MAEEGGRLFVTLEKANGQFNPTNLEWVALTMRRIWLRINEFVFKNKLCSPTSVIQSVNFMIADYSLALEDEPGSRNKERLQHSTTIWTKLNVNYVKVNWDVALDKFARRI